MNWPTYAVQSEDGRRPQDRLERGVCPHCGTENDPTFTFCRNCVHKLPVTTGR